MGHTVGSVAKAAGITVRTLHHYDALGLVSPSGRSAAGYRLYEQSDVERLQEVLFFRELGLGLEEIRSALRDSATNRLAILQTQKEALLDRRLRLEGVIAAVDQAIEFETEGRAMNKEEMLEVFGGFDPAEHQAEVEERWGAGDAFKTASRRTKGYSKDDWKEIKAEETAITKAFGALLVSGSPAASEEGADLAERHRQHIDRSFYPCSPAMHLALGDMYVADGRFSEYWEEVESGLAEYVREAIAANSLRSSSVDETSA